MSRIITADFLRAAYAAETGVFPILLLTVTHADLTETIRISTDPTERVEETTTEVVYGTISNGETFVFLPLSITLPGETDEGPSNMRVELENVSRTLTVVIRSLSSPPSVNVDIVLNTDVDTVLASWPEYLLVDIRMSAERIIGTLLLETLVMEPFPAGTFNPSEFPGGFSGVV